MGAAGREPAGLARASLCMERGKPVAEVAKTGSETLGPFEEIAGEVVYHAGFAGYFVLRFVNLALLGAVALAARRRHSQWNLAADWVASIAAAGYAVPCFCLGHTAGASGGKHRTFTG